MNKSLSRFYIGIITIFLTYFISDLYSQTRVRSEIYIPNIDNYLTLKCDFHMHTVFSDGYVWPTIRAEEAWRQGLDAIAITDHIEYQPHKRDIPSNHNRSAEIAAEEGQLLDILVIKGSEITRSMPPGHLNAIFIEDAEKLKTDTWREAIKAASDQKAFIFWNHPGWKGQQSDGVSRWYPEHTEILEKGMLHGIEVVNEKEYYPEVHRWCLEKNLTMMSNSDIHNPIQMEYDMPHGEYRPLTLVFAKERTIEAIKEALFAQRTAVYWNNFLIGKREFLEPIFYNSIQIKNPSIALKKDEEKYIQIKNSSDIDYKLRLNGEVSDLKGQSHLWLYSGKTILYEVKNVDATFKGEKKVRIPFQVENLKITPEEVLQVHLDLNVTFE